ncbi:hypothetical protein [Bacillus sp. JJ722]|uniref:hypothetical protein n=1 Tax=Bacillus sp. JJ722 TaxID=3122973 RepID=UPI003000EDB9
MTRKFNSKTTIVTICLVVVISVVTIYISFNNLDAIKKSNAPKVYNLNYSSDYEVNGDIEGLANSADFIVLGHYNKYIENWNMGENHEGEIYSFVVDQALMGSLKGEIEVSIPHSIYVSTEVDGKEYGNDVIVSNYHKPNLDKQYVLFLKKLQTRDSYGPSSVPFQIEIVGNTVELKYNEEIPSDIKTKNNDVIKINYEQIDLNGQDKVSRLTKNELFEQLNAVISNIK